MDIILRGLPRRAKGLTEGEAGDFFVTNALEAYSAIDLNLLGELMVSIPDFLTQNLLKVSDLDNIEEEYKSDNTFSIEYSLEKRLEFWEWWLTKAIPQAWELAEKSVADQK